MPRALLVLLAVWTSIATARAQRPDDAYLAGYATAVLAREFQFPEARVTAHGGVLTVHGAGLQERDLVRIPQVLAAIPGVVRVEFDGGEPATSGTASFLERSPLLFEPLHADPRWPHFSLAWHDYHGNDGLDDVAAASFGESFSLVRHRSDGDEWEVGLQAGVFSIFDLDAASFDLVNADYFFGPALTWRADRLSAMARIYHQSSHLGDEYLLREAPERINLSYEVADLLLSYDVSDALRLYAGGGYVLHSDTPLEEWSVQTGVEWMGSPFGRSGFRPMVACDLQLREENDWQGDVSARVGVEFADAEAPGGRMQILLEYYSGRSPNGQFFEQDIELLGIGVHFYF